MSALLLLLLLLQEPPRTSDDVELRLGGELDLHFVYRDSAIEESRNRLNGAPTAEDSETMFTGPVDLRLDLRTSQGWNGSLDVGTRPYEAGTNLTYGSRTSRLFFREAWVEFEPFLEERLRLRAGVQPLRFINRYGDKPFLLDLSGSESCWSGVTSAGTRTTADRNTLQPVGFRLHYDAALFLKTQLFAFTMDEGGGSGEDESVYGITASAKPGDDTTYKLITTLFSGPGNGTSVWTLGLGAAHAPEEHWLLAVEVYDQSGQTAPGTDKQAWALNASARYAESDHWIEAGFEYTSGDDPDDARDGGWQSYESVDRFIVVQSAEFGLDWDTNYQLLRAAGEWRVTRDTSLRLDAGWFSILEDVPGSAGKNDDLGAEADLTLSKDLTPSTRLYARTGALFASDFLESAAPGTGRSTWTGMLGIDLQF